MMHLRPHLYWLLLGPAGLVLATPVLAQDPEARPAPPAAEGLSSPGAQGGPSSRSAAIDAALGTPPSEGDFANNSTAGAGLTGRGTQRQADKAYGSTATTVGADGSIINGLQIQDPSLYPQEGGYTDEIPDYHIVQRGDTLWDISGYYLADPYTWPKVWSWNEHVTNAHWIFPGDRIRLYDPLRGRRTKNGPKLKFSKTKLPRGRGVGTYLLSQIAFVDADQFETSMKIVGGSDAKVMMATLDTVYMEYDQGNPPIPGERLVVYAPTKEVKDVEGKKTVGYIVQLMGEVEVDGVARKTSEGTVMASLNPIERGFRVGPLRRVFRRIETTEAERSATGVIVSTLNDAGPMPFKTKRHRRDRPKPVLAGENQFIVTNVGANDGVKVGNVLEVVRKGDEYSEKRTLDHPYQEGWPRRVVGALLVVEVQEETSLGVAIYTQRELERGDHVELRGPGLDDDADEDDESGRSLDGDANLEAGDGKAKGGFKLGG